MPFKSVLVKGLGKIKFPSEMSDQAIKEVIENNKQKWFHGTRQDFDSFDVNRSGSNTPFIQDKKSGVFFHSDREEAEFFTEQFDNDMIERPGNNPRVIEAMIDTRDSLTKNTNDYASNYFDKNMDDLVSEAESQGKKSIVIEGKDGKHLFVMDASKINEIDYSLKTLAPLAAGSALAALNSPDARAQDRIEGPKSPNILKVSNFIDQNDDIIFDDMLGGVTSYMNKLAYGDKIKFKDRLLAALDLL